MTASDAPDRSAGAALLGWSRPALFVVAAAIIVVVPLPGRRPAPVERTVVVQASQYQFSPAVIRVNPGDRVTLQLVSTDVVHGLSLDGYGLDVTAELGRSGSATFTARDAGVIAFRCSVPCGNMHPFMVGKLKVGTATLAWRTALLGLLVAVAAVIGAGGGRQP